MAIKIWTRDEAKAEATAFAEMLKSRKPKLEISIVEQTGREGRGCFAVYRNGTFPVSYSYAS